MVASMLQLPDGSTQTRFGHAGDAAEPACCHSAGELERLCRGAEIGRHRLRRELTSRATGTHPRPASADEVASLRTARLIEVESSTAHWWGSSVVSAAQAPRSIATRVAWQPQEHPRPLRPGQSVLPRVARPESMNYSSRLVRWRSPGAACTTPSTPKLQARPRRVWRCSLASAFSKLAAVGARSHECRCR